MTEESGPGSEGQDPAPKPKPAYGEYATPAEVAAARGIPIDRGGEHVDRLAAPIPPSAHVRHAPASRQRPATTRAPSQASTLITALLLVFGIWNTVTSIPTFLDLGRALSDGLESAGYGTITFGQVAHSTGIVLLVFSFVVLVVAIVASLRRIRAGRPSIWIPLVAASVWAVGLVIAMIVVVANTPGVTALMQNHS